MESRLLASVEALRIFGSTARGESDEKSDVDVLVVGPPRSDELENVITKYLSKYPAERLSFSWYSSNKVRALFREGDLFAWHLHKESWSLTSAMDILTHLGEPAPYRDGHTTFGTFRSLLDSSERHIRADDTSPTYEAGLLYAASRNIAMALSWHTPAGLNFSRLAPFPVSEAVDLSFPLSEMEYALLVSCRQRVQRGLPAQIPPQPWLLFACRSLIGWADALRDRVLT